MLTSFQKMRRHLLAVVFTFSCLPIVISERCPLFFGEFECPKDFTCVLGACKNGAGADPPTDCSKIECGLDSRCFDGKCLPIDALPCGRNTLVGENNARAIVSDCGWRGKCLNGRCIVDKCFEKLCAENEVCLEGTCTKLLDAFCWGHFDCAPGQRCQANRCKLPEQPGMISNIAQPKCDPGEVYRDHKCQKQPGCENLTCDPGDSCIDGSCAPVAFDCKTEVCPTGLICGENGICAPDPCADKACPPDNACLLGECRSWQGLICTEHCPQPFECINGRCAKNECRRKVCQIGERCENGLCIRVEGRLCSMALRDCGEEFDCQGEPKVCRDKITPIAIDNSTVTPGGAV